jgi:cytochrome o ubiquinol oxidase subunit III
MTHQEETFSKTLFGFWLYLMTDCVLFSILFATYAVLHNNTYGGPSSQELFSLPVALTETFALLISSFTCGLARIAAYNHKKKQVLFWFFVTFLLGICFITLELREFSHFVQEGNSWKKSAFLSSFFTLVGTHGLHISVGLFWMLYLMVAIALSGLNPNLFRRLSCLSFFWHFLDVVWIFIFTIVYLMGVL